MSFPVKDFQEALSVQSCEKNSIGAIRGRLDVNRVNSSFNFKKRSEFRLIKFISRSSVGFLLSSALSRNLLSFLFFGSLDHFFPSTKLSNSFLSGAGVLLIPGVRKDLSNCQSLFRVIPHHFLEEVPEFSRKVVFSFG